MGVVVDVVDDDVDDVDGDDVDVVVVRVVDERSMLFFVALRCLPCLHSHSLFAVVLAVVVAAVVVVFPSLLFLL